MSSARGVLPIFSFLASWKTTLFGAMLAALTTVYDKGPA
jgi:hypothetical protein